MARKNNQGSGSVSFIDRLHQFQFHDAKGQFIVFALTAIIALAYALINDLLLGRPERNVMVESAILTAILVVTLTAAYNSGFISSIVSDVKKRRRGGVEGRGDDLVALAETKNVFISHSCKDHSEDGSTVCDIRDGLNRLGGQFGWNVIFDPFDPGDKTCLKVQEKIKQSTHFILLNTANSSSSRWVFLESLFAKLCYDQNAICYIPVNLDGSPVREEAEELISVNWNGSDSVEELVTKIADRIRATNPQPSPNCEPVRE